ncbi:hypothetical protein [Enhygromyxa salina]|uniref:DUF4350 domain-containing protein n=1 Tax=Enhygromyxa salina TaxID=215803 RepID=A0A2S9XU88_9BACT|nr:hypothetical protein [Enhygromyxa salina]PRP96281.1 hypothetical protein ENSA7_70960 [Enhygromyxa salina]
MRAQIMPGLPLLGLALLACKPGPDPNRVDRRGAAEAPEPAIPSAASDPATPARPRVIVEGGPDVEGGPRYRIEVPDPSHARGAGPRVGIDIAHNNYAMPHNYDVFADALRADGFVVSTLEHSLDADALAGLELLVVVNPLHDSNLDNWALPVPSAFGPEELEAIEAWVSGGGSLWLIADHMPFPGAAADLGARFGFTLNNGFAFREPEPGRVDRSMIQFRREDATIVAGHPITAGLEQVQSFTGEAFEAPPEAATLLVMPDDGVSLMPAVAWEFDADTPKQAVGGWPVAAVREFEGGRVAVFGEAAMLSARFVEQGDEWIPVGVHAPAARDNLALVLATARWLMADSQMGVISK